jgi:hypothetical protein
MKEKIKLEDLERDEDLTATYSPEDNKLRLYAVSRLDEAVYQTIREAGFRWAPKQDLFVAPAWNPLRADILTALCGSIGDEDKSLEARQDERAERFEEYQGKRLADADRAHDAVKELTENIPFGQPILVGHHSEKRARKDAERIERGMEKAVKMWETSEYWKWRAAGVLRHAKYKDRPEVRARRIKKLEAEGRKYQKYINEAEGYLKAWTKAETEEQVLFIARASWLSRSYSLEEYPRPKNIDQYEGAIDIHSAIVRKIIQWQTARKHALRVYPGTVSYYTRWVNHTTLRVEYERALLEEQGEGDLLKPKPRPKQLPLLNYRQPEGFEIENPYHKGTFSHYPQKEMTKAEYKAIYKENKGGELIDGTHRIRVVCQLKGQWAVFLTDSKEHPKPGKEVAA